MLDSIKLEKNELKIVLLSASYFFLLLCAYYILRPVRETIGISRSADDLPLIFLGTMTVTLLMSPGIGALVSNYSRREFIPIAYRIISGFLLCFFLLLTNVQPEYRFAFGIGFYIFLSVINMLLISLFWGFMSDGLSFEQSKKLFPSIAIGGTIGAIAGSTIAQQLVELVGQYALLLISIIFLELALGVMRKVDDYFQRLPVRPETQKVQLSHWQANNNASAFTRWTAGIRFVLASPYSLAIAGYIFCYGLTSTFLYFHFFCLFLYLHVFSVFFLSFFLK